MIHISTHTSISASSSENEIWEKEFSLLVQQEELEDFLGVHDDLSNAPSPSQQPHRHILLSLDAIQPHMDWVEDYMSHMESSCRKNSANEQWKAAEQANCQEELMRKISCIRWSWWRKSTQVDGFLYSLTNGRDLSHWKCSHGPFGWSVRTFSGWMRGHLFVFPA